MIKRAVVFVAAMAWIVVASGCSVDTQLGGTPVPNSRPDTRVTGQPPTLLEAGFAVEFRWTGSDPDGEIVGYQWKISDNGTDGISPRDTLTTDPLTGAVLRPWHFTTANDSIFLVLADQPDFPGDAHGDPRSFRSHTLFIRAVDDKGAVDSSPAMLSFTSTTLVPTAWAIYPNLPHGANAGAKVVPTTVSVGWRGTDPDFETQMPTRARFLWTQALNASGGRIRTQFEYNLHYAEVLDFDDPNWSPWRPYSSVDADRRVSFSDLIPNEYYLFAVQTQDTAGAVSVGLSYQNEVGHFNILANVFQPAVTLAERFMGRATNSEFVSEIAGGQPLNFSWTASATAYNGTIVAYRHGWDLLSVDDPNDPGWSVPPGVTQQNRMDVERTFQDGVHTFTLRVEDSSRQVKIMTWTLRVVPFVTREFQHPLMILDQVVDHEVGNWPDQSGIPRNDELYRNPWWEFLGSGVGGVAGVNWERDWREHTADVTFSDLVNYQVVLCYAQTNDLAQRMFMKFRPENNIDKFVWLAPYQARGGNLFLVGGSSMESFLESKSNYMVPMVFDTREVNLVVGGDNFEIGFGDRVLPDGTRVRRGPLMYPYATAGISALDWTSPGTKTIYNRRFIARFDRTADCVGLKGLVLDDAFRNNQLIGPGVIADTMWTDPQIDWQDHMDAAADTLRLLHNTFAFRNDEFVDANISTRSTVIVPQTCTEGPGGMCIEPMFRGIARFDFVREYQWSHGEPDWPANRYTEDQLINGCGPMALTSYQGQSLMGARTNGKVFGYFSYKTIADKPVPRADVYWGFDPYRFDHVEATKAIRWVLQYFGLQINQ